MSWGTMAVWHWRGDLAADCRHISELAGRGLEGKGGGGSGGYSYIYAAANNMFNMKLLNTNMLYITVC